MPRKHLIMNQSLFDLLKVGIGPSSSHTLGPLNMARFFREEISSQRVQKTIQSLRVTLHGSLAMTGEGHLTPNAIIAGLMGYDAVETPIEDIQQATAKLLMDGGMQVSQTWLAFSDRNFIHFVKDLKNLQHPNTATFEALDSNGSIVKRMEFCSIGGGAICDPAKVSAKHRNQKRRRMSFVRILKECKLRNLSLLEWTLDQEKRISGLDEKEIYCRLLKIWNIMLQAIDRGLAGEGILPGKLGVSRRAKKSLKQFMTFDNPLQKALPAMGRAGIYALAVSEENASGGRIITAPTCGACGVVPGVLNMLFRDLNVETEKILEGLVIAGLIGNIVVDRASISGAEVGCQGEVGVACAMAAGACAMINGGSNSQIEGAAEAALEHHLGLTCDPIMGLVQVPCIERNAIAAGTAINSANLALLGEGRHLISFDQCVDTMMATGCDMPNEYKETSLGGLATTHC